MTRPDPRPVQGHHDTRSSSTSVEGSSGTQRTRIEKVPTYACERHSPRPCVNQALVDELAVLLKYRSLEYGTNHRKCISYARAVSAIIGTPWVIRSGKEAKEYIPFVADKLASKIDEFLSFGSIEEAEQLRKDERFKTLKLLTEVWSVGPEAAKQLYDAGHRSLESLRSVGKHPLARYHADMQIKIPRSEVESVHDWIKIQLDKVEPGAHTVLTGGYRRGKSESNDIDILITYPHEDGKERGVLEALLHRLQKKGLVPEDGILIFSNAASNRTTVENRAAESFDALDRAFVIFKHPANGTTRKRDYWRRVDLVVTRWPAWGPAIVGCAPMTPSKLTEECRRGFKFDSGGLRTANTSEVVPAQTEKDVFRVLGLAYIEPHLRNADP